MRDTAVGQTIFLTSVSTPNQRSEARLQIDSIRSFGGDLSGCPVWLFEADPERAPCEDLGGQGVRVLPLDVPDTVSHNWFAGKVCACARAEELATPEVHSLVWLAPDCLILNPPLLLELGPTFDVAVRPVHVRNVGIPITEPVDAFWAGVYEAAGVQDVEVTVESFVDRQRLRAYFNSHVMAVNPAAGLLRRWFELFQALMCNARFQAEACRDVDHQVFLHQAVLSTLIATSIDPERVRALPPDYSYPYNLHHLVPADRRARSLNELVCIAREDRPLDPDAVTDIDIHEPLRSWLSTRLRV